MDYVTSQGGTYMTDAEIRYIILKNIDHVALSSTHAQVLEKLVRAYELELVNIPCLRKEELDKLIESFEKKKLLIHVHDVNKFTLPDLNNINLIVVLLNIEKNVSVFSDLLKITTDILTTIFVTFSRSLVGFNIKESKEALRAVAFITLARIYRPKGSISSLLSWGKSLNLIGDVGSNQLLIEKSFEESTICAIWQQAIYLIAAKRSVPLSTINVLFRRKELLQICRDIESKMNNLSEHCTFEGVRIIYNILNSFVGFSTLTYKRLVTRLIAKQAKEYKQQFEELLINATKKLL